VMCACARPISTGRPPCDVPISMTVRYRCQGNFSTMAGATIRAPPVMPSVIVSSIDSLEY
jgi:hypothetical protein